MESERELPLHRFNMEHFKDPGIREECQKQLAPFRESFRLLADLSTLKRPEKKKAIDSLQILINDKALSECEPINAAIILDELSGFLNEWQESKIEYVREKGLSYAMLIVQKALLPNSLIEKLLSLALARLQHQRTGIVLSCTEPTEEIRMKWLILLLDILRRLHQDDAMDPVNVEKSLDIIKLAMEDPFPEVQKKGGQALLELVTKCPKGTALAGQRSMQLVLPLLYHKHSAIRATGVLAAGQIALAVPDSVSTLLEYDRKANRQAEFPSLVQDTAFNVRDVFSGVISMWLMRMAPSYRRKFAPILIPLLLSSAVDEVPSIADASKARLSEIGALYCDDLVAAGTLDVEPHTPEECAQAGLQYLVHDCYKECLKHLFQETLQLDVNRRARALDVMRLLFGYTQKQDLFESSNALIDHLFNVYSNGKTEAIITNKVKEILHVLGARIPDAVYIPYLVKRFKADDLLHAETMCLGAEGLSIAIILLRGLISGAPFGSISNQDIDIVLCALEAPHIYEEFIESEELILETAKLLTASIQHLTKPIPDTVRVLIIWTGLILRAASAVRQNLNHVAMADQFRCNLGSSIVVAEVDHASLYDLHPQPTMSDIFGRYSPTLLQWLESARTTRNPREWVETSIEVKMLEIIVTALDPDALDDTGVPEQLAWMLRSAGSSSGAGKAGKLGCVGVRIRSMEMLSFLFQIDIDYAHFRPYTAELFGVLFNPGLHSVGVDTKQSNIFHVALLDCIRNGIECEAFSNIPSDLPALVKPYLHAVDGSTNTSALTLMSVLIKKLVVDNDGSGQKWDESAIPPILSFLDYINHDNLLSRQIILKGLLEAPSTSVVFRESRVLNRLKECLDKQLDSGGIDDPDHKMIHELIEKQGLGTVRYFVQMNGNEDAT